LTPHLPTQQATPKSEEKQSHEKLERKSLCPLDILEAISTIRVRHDEERACRFRLEQQRNRAPRHWLHPLVERSRCAELLFGRCP
jgi:hypothetical protein